MSTWPDPPKTGTWTIGPAAIEQFSILANAVLCRNNAPLVSLAFKLIPKRIGFQMLGRDFGKSLGLLLKKVCGSNDALPAEDCREKIIAWKDREIRLAEVNNKPSVVDRIRDQSESILAVIDSGQVSSLREIRSWLIEIFEQKDTRLTLATGHKAKGLEWHTVIHLDPFRLPSKWAIKAGEGSVPMQQERNLQYVIETRAKHTLILADLEDFR